MSNRELVILGTASQAPTRYRNHNGYFLRWDSEGFLFDPGEGTQRQMLLAGVTPRSISRIFITHFHGDHCLGLPGILQRLNLDSCPHPIKIYFPGEDLEYFERLRDCSRYDSFLNLVPCPVSGPLFKEEDDENGIIIEARPLEHRIPTYGYRISEKSSLRFFPDKLKELGLKGHMVGELASHGSIEHNGHTILLQDVTEQRTGMVFSFIMDTRPCEAAMQLALHADLMVMESTYLHSEAKEAADHSHCTAQETAQLAANAHVKRLVLAHFSQRYEKLSFFQAEANQFHDQVWVAQDFDRIPVPWGRKYKD